jgi:DNA-binding CsgD family transcriptional regulator/tetratricopeptide (TPR) repeat protein
MATRLSSPNFIGRRAELSQLQAAAERAARGEPALVLVAGEAGVGKTRLVEELAGWARQHEYQVLVGGCVSLSADVAPFAPIVEALRPLTRHLAQADLDAVLGPNVHGLAPVLPDVASVTEATASTGVSPDSAQGRLLELLLGMLGRLAARAPVMLVIEDIQWADRSTVDVLAFLARNLRAEQVLMVSTFRTDEPESRRQLLPLIAELGRHGGAERIDLPPLNRAEVAEQLSAILGAPAASGLIDGVFTRSQGNAFFSEELLAAESIAGTLPQTLRDVLTARVGALTPEAEELARVASAAGRRFSESMLARMTDVDGAAFRAALHEAIEHQILVREQMAGGERLGFRHALVQELLYDDLLPSERVRLHAACARAIEERLTAAPDAVLASELAYHWQAADEPERALHASIAAGLAAESAGARTEAALQFERAIALLKELPGSEANLPLDRIQLLEHAAGNYQNDPVRAVEHIATALKLVDAERDPVRAGLLHAALGRNLWFSGDGAGALAACREAVRLVPRQPPSVARARVAAGLGQILMILAHTAEGIGYCEEAVKLAAQTGARAIESHALNTLGILTAYFGDVEGGLDMLYRALDIANEIVSVDDIGRAYGNLTDVLIFAAARYDEAGDIGMEAMGSVDAPMFTGVIAALLHGDVALARYLGGRWDEARADLDRARLQPAGGAGEIVLGIRAAQLQVGRGEFEEATRQLDVLRRQLEGAADMQWIAPATAAQAELAIWTGDPGAALQAVADGLKRVHLSSGANISRIGPMLAFGVRAAADIASRGGRRRSASDQNAARREGMEHVAAMRANRDEIAVRWPAQLHLAEPYLALCEAEASRLGGRSDPEAWATAAGLYHGLGQPYVRAYAQYREGEALLAARRDASRARSALREAHAVAVRLGAAPLRAAIEEVAARGRVDLSERPVARGRSTGPGGLTAREQEILALVADGLSNRQIGERLFITEKTASHHVSNILGKLGVAGRVEAAAEAVRLGITARPT